MPSKKEIKHLLVELLIHRLVALKLGHNVLHLLNSGHVVILLAYLNKTHYVVVNLRIIILAHLSNANLVMEGWFC